ncbi:NifB/NifX family molybdenum-iron cluster-binding protein [Candidatus Bathyarchaeota archaeon]|nr:NifB/NifX family molybdenum-iron cluster-binding protein [Candidatus Bathyarchaeota archaeon]
MRIAIPTEDNKGLNDKVYSIFAKAPTYTLIDIENEKVKKVEVKRNPAALLNQGAGPIFAKKLKDENVDLVITAELGPGALTILDTLEIKSLIVKKSIKVSNAVKEGIKSIII